MIVRVVCTQQRPVLGQNVVRPLDIKFRLLVRYIFISPFAVYSINFLITKMFAAIPCVAHMQSPSSKIPDRRDYRRR